MDKNWEKILTDITEPAKVSILSRFFKTAPREYGKDYRFVKSTGPVDQMIVRTAPALSPTLWIQRRAIPSFIRGRTLHKEMFPLDRHRYTHNLK